MQVISLLFLSCLMAPYPATKGSDIDGTQPISPHIDDIDALLEHTYVGNRRASHAVPTPRHKGATIHKSEPKQEEVEEMTNTDTASVVDAHKPAQKLTRDTPRQKTTRHPAEKTAAQPLTHVPVRTKPKSHQELHQDVSLARKSKTGQESHQDAPLVMKPKTRQADTPAKESQHTLKDVKQTASKNRARDHFTREDRELFTTDIEKDGELVLEDDCELTTRMASLTQVNEWLKPTSVVTALSLLSVANVVALTILLLTLYMRRHEPDLSTRSPQLLALGAMASALCSFITMWAYQAWVVDGNNSTLLRLHDWCYTALIPLFLLSLSLRAARLTKLSELELHKTDLHRLLPVKGGGAEMRVKQTESGLRTTVLDEIQAQLKSKQDLASEWRFMRMMGGSGVVLVLYASAWSLIEDKASCPSRYMHTFNSIFVLFVALALMRWFCNLKSVDVREAFGIMAEIRILTAISLLLGAVHVILHTYLRLFATDPVQLAVGMAFMFLNLNAWMVISSIFSLGWPIIRLSKQRELHRLTTTKDESFDVVMKDKDARALFFDFVQKLFCSELALLWTDVDTFRGLAKEERGHQEAWVIYNKYLKSNAVLKVPMAAEFFYGISSTLERSQQPPTDMYDTVQEMVSMKLSRCFRRYQLQNLSDLIDTEVPESIPFGAKYDVPTKNPASVQGQAQPDDDSEFNSLFEDSVKFEDTMI